MKNERLESRCWDLYNFLKDNGKVSVYDICSALPQYYELRQSDKTHNPCCLVSQDIDRLNMSSQIEKIIISDSHYNFWLAESKDQVLDYADRLYFKRALRQLKKYWNMVDKVNANGQGKIIGCSDKVIDSKSKARDFVETFLTHKIIDEISDSTEILESEIKDND